MNRSNLRAWALAAAFAALPAYAGELAITDGWSRTTPSGVTVGVAYFTLKNDTGKSDRLLKITTPVAAKVQVHRTEIQDGMARMREVAVLHVDAGQSLEFKPGAKWDQFKIDGTETFDVTGEIEPRSTLTVVIRKAFTERQEVAGDVDRPLDVAHVPQRLEVALLPSDGELGSAHPLGAQHDPRGLRRGGAGGTGLLHDLWLRWPGPLGLAHRQAHRALEQPVRVWPDLSPVRSPMLQAPRRPRLPGGKRSGRWSLQCRRFPLGPGWRRGSRRWRPGFRARIRRR